MEVLLAADLEYAGTKLVKSLTSQSGYWWDDSAGGFKRRRLSDNNLLQHNDLDRIFPTSHSNVTYWQHLLRSGQLRH
jgi:hypothetical protein